MILGCKLEGSDPDFVAVFSLKGFEPVVSAT
jgi:hypothetical protein